MGAYSEARWFRHRARSSDVAIAWGTEGAAEPGISGAGCHRGHQSYMGPVAKERSVGGTPFEESAEVPI